MFLFFRKISLKGKKKELKDNNEIEIIELPIKRKYQLFLNFFFNKLSSKLILNVSGFKQEIPFSPEV